MLIANDGVPTTKCSINFCCLYQLISLFLNFINAHNNPIILSYLCKPLKYYKLPRTKLVLSVLADYVPNDDEFGTHLVLSMLLGKKKILSSPDFDNEKLAKDVINVTFALYPIRAFDKGAKGLLSTSFLGKRKPILIMMKCKKVKKAGS